MTALTGTQLTTNHVNGDITITLSWYLHGETKLCKLLSKKAGIWAPHEIVKVSIAIDGGELWVTHFFSRVMMIEELYIAMLPEERAAVKGLAYASLCKLLAYIINQKLVSPSQEVFLNAVNSKFNVNRIQPLVNMYRTRGFWPIYSDYSSQDRIVSMTSTVDVLLENSKNKVRDISQYTIV